MVLLLEVTDVGTMCSMRWQPIIPYNKPRCVTTTSASRWSVACRWKISQVRELGRRGSAIDRRHAHALGEKLTLIGTHPLHPGHEGWRLRNEQFAALAKFCRGQTGPVVVIGDLNSTSWSAHFGTLLDGTRLRDSRAGFGVQASWPAWSPLPRIPIDHCLVSPEIVGPQSVHRPDVGSDHFPLVVDLATGADSDPGRSENGRAGRSTLISTRLQAGADQGFVVAGKDVPIGKRRMRPADAVACGPTARASARSAGRG